MLLAFDDIKNDRIKSLREAAKLYDLPVITLHARAHGRISRGDTRLNGYKLTQLEEDSLTQWILSMDSRGAAPRPSTVREMANILLVARGTNPLLTVGVNWALAFVKRRDELRTRFSKRYDYQRALNEDLKAIKEWFLMVQRVIEENGIQPEDIYNFDETGFAMGLISSQRVVTRAEYYGRRSILHPGNREWVTAIETICADGCRCVLYLKARFISLVGLKQISLGIGELKCRIMAGLPMKSAFAGFKRSLFHALLRVYEGDFGC
jgi:hypothetical protein